MPDSATDRRPATEVDQIVAGYIERYLAMFPTRATVAGDRRYDRELEDLTEVRLADWVEFNRNVVETLEVRLGEDSAQQLDARAVLRQARSELFRHDTLRVSRTDPLFWTGIVGGSASHLLVRDDLPLLDRLRALAVRVGDVPRLCRQARETLAGTRPQDLAAFRVSTAARRAESLAVFFSEGLAEASAGLTDSESTARGRNELRERLATVGRAAAGALRELAEFLRGLESTASGSARLGDLYAESFRLGTGVDQPVAEVLADAERRLGEERSQTAVYCRSIWTSEGIDRSSGLAGPPRDDVETVRACFARIARDHADDLEDFLRDFQDLAAAAETFAVRQGLVTLPEGFRLFVRISPAYLVGQTVGGVYPPGPFMPEGAVLLFVPSYPEGTPEEAAAAFYRDFNDHFNAMITPHETVPGHGAQLAQAAHRAARTGQIARELFSDGVYVEGWGTFSELLMLDAGWGSPLDRVAHLKKRLENIARLIVDVRVHTSNVSKDEILRFVRDEAVQDEQFAANMWRRALLSSPQLTTYDLGSRRIYQIYQAERRRLGSAFDAGGFVRAMTRLGSVSLAAYERAFPSIAPSSDRLLDSPSASRDLSSAGPPAGAGIRPDRSPRTARVAALPGSSNGL